MKTGIQKLHDDLRKKYGERAVMFAGDIPPSAFYSSGSLALDYAIGKGGLPNNRVVEFAGAAGAGKTTVALHAVNNFLNAQPERYALYIDIENRLTPDWLENFVEDSSRVLVIKPDTAEEAHDIYDEAVKGGDICIAVFDSIGGAPTQRATNKSATIGDMGGNSLAIGRFARSASTLSGKYDCCTIGINQVRDDFSGYHRFTTPGGMAWKHACSVRVEFKQATNTADMVFEEVDGEKTRVGYKVSAKIHKNSIAAPFKECYYWFYNIKSKYGFGVDQIDEIIRLGMATGVITRLNMTSYEHPLIGKVTGRDKVIAAIRSNPTTLNSIRDEIVAHLNEGGVEGITTSFEPSEEPDDAEIARGKSLIKEYGAEA